MALDFTQDNSKIKITNLDFQDLYFDVSHVNLKLDSSAVLLYALVNHTNLYMEAFADPDSPHRWLEDTFAFADATALHPSLGKTDSFQLTEVTALAISKGAADTLSISESFAKELTYIRAFADTSTLSESIQTIAVGKNINETPTLGESKVFDLSKASSDTASISESFAQLFGLSRSDSTTMSDSFSKVTAFARTFTDSYALDDTASASDDLRTDIGINKNNVVTMSESLSYYMDWVDSLADSFSLVDAPAINFSQGTTTDSFSVADSPVLSFSTTFTDSATISESILVELIIGRGAKLNQSIFNAFMLNS